MNRKRKSFSETPPRQHARSCERGNAMVYVLIIVALFAALTWVLSRQTDTTEVGIISEEQLEIYTSTMQQTAMQLKQSLDQMAFSGTNVDEMNFITPDDPDFNDPDPNPGAPTHGNKVFHPHGGGVVMPRLPDGVIVPGASNAGWYIDKKNDIEWTPEPKDVVLTAYKITDQLCQRLNEKLTGSGTVPVMSEPAYDVILYHSALSSTISFTSADCADCYGKPSLCVEDTNGDKSFYSVVTPVDSL